MYWVYPFPFALNQFIQEMPPKDKNKTNNKQNLTPVFSPSGLRNMTDVNSLRNQWKDEFKSLADSLHEEINSKLCSFFNSSNANVLENDQIMTIRSNLTKHVDSSLQNLETKWCKVFDDLQEKINQLEQSYNLLRDGMDSIDQYNRRQSLVVFGLEESDNEDPLMASVDFLNNTFNCAVMATDFVSVHRLGRSRNGVMEASHGQKENNRYRPMIIKFSRMHTRDKIFYNKKILKGSGVTIAEHLTPSRNSYFKNIRTLGFNSWTSNGNIILSKDNGLIKLNSLSDMSQFIKTCLKPTD